MSEMHRIVENQSWILYHDNATAYTLMLVCELLATNKTVIMLQPPYSPLLPKLKTPMKEKRFATIEEVKETWEQKLLEIQKGRFRSVSRIGITADISVLNVRGATLQGTR